MYKAILQGSSLEVAGPQRGRPASRNSAGKQLRGGRATARATVLSDRGDGSPRVDGERQSLQSRRHVATHPSESGL